MAWRVTPSHVREHRLERVPRSGATDWRTDGVVSVAITRGRTQRLLFDIESWPHEIGFSHCVIQAFAIFHTPNLFGGLDLRHVLQTDFGLCIPADLQKIWQSYRQNETHDGYDDQDFD